MKRIDKHLKMKLDIGEIFGTRKILKVRETTQLRLSLYNDLSSYPTRWKTCINDAIHETHTELERS